MNIPKLPWKWIIIAGVVAVGGFIVYKKFIRKPSPTEKKLNMSVFPHQQNIAPPPYSAMTQWTPIPTPSFTPAHNVAPTLFSRYNTTRIPSQDSPQVMMQRLQQGMPFTPV